MDKYEQAKLKAAMEWIEKLEEYIIELHPYCYNCKWECSGEACDECHRKMFNWGHRDSIPMAKPEALK